MTSFSLSLRKEQVQRNVESAAIRGGNDTLVATTLEAQQRAPRDTGFLANTIAHQGIKREGGALVGRVGNWTADYALWQEIGTGRMAAQPYLRPAAAAQFPLLIDRIRRYLP